jgi:hypothetical protein
MIDNATHRQAFSGGAKLDGFQTADGAICVGKEELGF